MYDPIEGTRVTLRQPLVDDAPRMAELADEPEIARFTRLPVPYRLEHALGFIASVAAKADVEEYAITTSEGLIGMMSLMEIDREAGVAEVGYWLGSVYRGRGYAGEALDLLLARAFSKLGLVRVWARANVENEASRGLLEGRGFVFERYAHESVKEGESSEMARYGLSRSEWEKGKKVGQRT